MRRVVRGGLGETIHGVRETIRGVGDCLGETIHGVRETIRGVGDCLQHCQQCFGRGADSVMCGEEDSGGSGQLRAYRGYMSTGWCV